MYKILWVEGTRHVRSTSTRGIWTRWRVPVSMDCSRNLRVKSKRCCLGINYRKSSRFRGSGSRYTSCSGHRRRVRAQRFCERLVESASFKSFSFLGVSRIEHMRQLNCNSIVPADFWDRVHILLSENISHLFRNKSILQCFEWKKFGNWVSVCDEREQFFTTWPLVGRQVCLLQRLRISSHNSSPKVILWHVFAKLKRQKLIRWLW